MSTNMRKDELELKKIQMEIEEIRAKIDKMIKETTLYPFVVGASITLAFVAIAKLFL